MYVMIRKFFSLCFLSFILCLPAFSQLPFFHHYYLLKKNEPVQVNKIFQDRYGFLWFGTNQGLFRFNGRNYLRYTVADSLPDNHITAIAQDSIGNIWTGHHSGAVAFIKNGIVHKFDPPEGSATKPVSDILFDRNGHLWFSTLNDGLYFYKTNRLHRLDEQEGLPDPYIYDLLEDEDGNVWAGTDGGIAVCTIKTRPAIEVLDHKDGLPDNIVRKLVEYDKNSLLLATEDAGIIWYDKKLKSFRPVIPGQWAHGSVLDFLVKDNKIWVTTALSGLMVYDLETLILKRYNKQPGYHLAQVRTMQQDREGNVWAGTKSGVARTIGDHIEFVEPRLPTGDLNVLAVAADKNDKLWFSTGDGLFCQSTDASGQVVTERPLAGTKFQRYSIISLYVDNENFIWAGLYGEGALRINPRNGKVTHLNRELKNGNVLNITGRDNTVWLATLGGSERITILPNEKLNIKNYSRENGLSSDFIYQVFLDSQDRVWFATDGKGADVLDKNGLRHYEEGLPSKVIYGFAEDAQNRIWANVQGNGIYQFDGNRFIPPPPAITVRDNDIQSLSADRDGNLVMVHDFGIDQYNVQTNRIRFFGEEAGIRDRQATLNAISSDENKNIFIGTSHGVVTYTHRQDAAGQKPLVFIDAMKIFDKKIPVLQDMQFTHDENSVTLNFLGFWYQDTENLYYRYMLENFDENWISTRDNAVTYSRLPAGDYTFRIKISDAADFSESNEATLHFRITPPFWKTIPFYAAIGVLLMVSGYSLIQFREKKLRQDKEILEAKVLERTLEIQRKTEEIQAQNEEIMAQAEEIKGINENLEMLVNQRTAELEKKNKALAEYAFINAHKLRSPLASILGLTNLISKTNLDAEAREINKHLQQRADELDDIIRSITKAIERGEK
jgi:ligand-binding sensor domain-containing protein